MSRSMPSRSSGHHFGALLEEAEPQDQPGSETIYGMVDGSMVLTRTDGWKEVKLGRLFGAEAHEKGEKRSRITASTYTAHLGSQAEFLPKWEAELAGISSAHLVFLADGASWFWDWATERHPRAVQILDYYHAKGYLSIVRAVFALRLPTFEIGPISAMRLS